MVVRYLQSSTPSELFHHGIKGQKWGVENGPPYPLGSSISTGKKLKKTNNVKNDVKNRSINTKYIKKAALAIGIAAGVSLTAYAGYKLYNKIGPKYLDKTLKNRNLYTLSLRDVTSKLDDETIKNNRFYASFKKSDNNLYLRKYGKSLMSRANRDISYGGDDIQELHQIINKSKNIKIASINKTEKIFENTYNADENFKKTVNSWLKSSELTSRIGGFDFRLGELYSKAEKGDAKSAYELFNRLGYVNRGNEHADEIQKSFKKVLNKQGYNAIYDLNDIRGDYKANSPIIVLNSDSVIKQAANKISEDTIENARKKYIISENAKLIGKYAGVGLTGSSAATYGLSELYDRKKGDKHGS